MTERQNGDSSQGSVEANFTQVCYPPHRRGDALTPAQALSELAKGEQAVTALENHLTALESKIDELLARASEDEAIAEEQKQSRSGNAKASSAGKDRS